MTLVVLVWLLWEADSKMGLSIQDTFKRNIGKRKLGKNQRRLGEPSDQSAVLIPRKGEKEGCREGGKAWGEERGRNRVSWQARSILDGRAVLGRVREDHYEVFKPKSLTSRVPHLSGWTWLSIPASPSHWLEAVPGSKNQYVSEQSTGASGPFWPLHLGIWELLFCRHHIRSSNNQNHNHDCGRSPTGCSETSITLGVLHMLSIIFKQPSKRGTFAPQFQRGSWSLEG